MPDDVPKRIKRVDINYHFHHDYFMGFIFYDKDQKYIWMMGVSPEEDPVKTVVLEENEVIFGVVAKLDPECQSIYTDF